MKALLLSFLYLFVFCIPANAQWTLQHEFTGVTSLGLPRAVDENVYWGLLTYSSGAIGYFKTTDGGTAWQDGIITTAPFASCIHPRSASIAYCGVNLNSGQWKIIKTIDGGTSWIVQNSAYSLISYIDFIYFFDENNGVTLGDPVGGYLEIYTTTNGGDNWVRVPNSNIPQAYAGEVGLQMVFTTKDNTVWVPTYKENPNSVRIFKSTNRGLNWTVSNDLPNPMPAGMWPYPYSIAFANQNEGIIAVTSWTSPGPPNYYKLMKTTDGGSTWTEMNFPLSISVASICTVPGTAQGYVVTAPFDTIGSAYTLDGGTTWQLADNTVGLAEVQFASPSTGWAINWDTFRIYEWSGPYLPVELTSFTATTNGKEVVLNWSTATEINNQLFEVQRSFEGSDFASVGFVNGKGTTTERQDYSYSDKNLSDGKYFYRLKQIDYLGRYEYSDVLEVDYRTFKDYLLEQNYPNPFNPTTTIGFGIKEKSFVKVVILNNIGEEVAIVANEEMESGFHSVEFNAVNLPSGVYFYQLRAGEFTSMKKMILLK